MKETKEKQKQTSRELESLESWRSPRAPTLTLRELRTVRAPETTFEETDDTETWTPGTLNLNLLGANRINRFCLLNLIGKGGKGKTCVYVFVYTHWNLQSSEYVRDELGRGRPDSPPDSSPSILLSVLLVWLFARFTSRLRFSLILNPYNLSSSVLMDVMSFLAINFVMY